jgi:hypothetical protein
MMENVNQYRLSDTDAKKLRRELGVPPEYDSGAPAIDNLAVDSFINEMLRLKQSGMGKNVVTLGSLNLASARRTIPECFVKSDAHADNQKSPTNSP